MENKSNKKLNNKPKKIVIKDKKKFYRTIGIFAILLLLIVVIINFSNKDININDNTNIQNININKYSSKIKLYYEGLMNDFIAEYNNIQNLTWTYIYSNLVEGKGMDELIDEVNQILESGNLSSLGIEKSTKWRGKYRLDKDTNVLLFKFENKNIEPSWIEDSSVSYIIERN